jgi:hypothetical protein
MQFGDGHVYEIMFSHFSYVSTMFRNIYLCMKCLLFDKINIKTLIINMLERLRGKSCGKKAYLGKVFILKYCS